MVEVMRALECVPSDGQTMLSANLSFMVSVPRNDQPDSGHAADIVEEAIETFEFFESPTSDPVASHQIATNVLPFFRERIYHLIRQERLIDHDDILYEAVQQSRSLHRDTIRGTWS